MQPLYSSPFCYFVVVGGGVVVVGAGACVVVGFFVSCGVFCFSFGWVFLREWHLVFAPCFAEKLFRKGISDWSGLITFLVC